MKSTVMMFPRAVTSVLSLLIIAFFLVVVDLMEVLTEWAIIYRNQKRKPKGLS